MQAQTWSGGDDRGPNWSYGKVVDDKGNVVHVGNWSGGQPPTSSGSAYLGAPGYTDLDVQTSISGLTFAAGGGLNMKDGSALTVTNTNFATDGTITLGGGGGGFPVYTNAGTLTKSAGTGTFAFAGDITFVSAPGSAITAASGTLQLPGNSGLLDTVIFDPAAGAVIDLVSQGASSAFYNYFQGRLSNGNGTGTVRLSQGTMGGTQRIVASPQPCTLAFTGGVFQWTGGLIGSYQQGAVFVNTGVVNISGDAAKETDANFTNQGTVIHTGAGAFDVGDFNSGGSFTNAAGAIYDLRSDANIGQSGYAFNNAGLFKKSGGTGTSTLSVSFNNQGGTIEVDSGTLQMALPNNSYGNDSLSTGGTFNVAAGALLDLGDGSTFTGTYTGGGGGTVRFSQGTLTPDKPAATVFNFPGGMFQWTGGIIGTYQGSRVFTNVGVLNLSGDGEKDTYATFTNQGMIIQTGAGAFNIGAANSGGSFTNAAGATYNLASDASIGQSGYGFTNAGLFEKTAGTGVSKMDVELTNKGTLAVYTGTLNFTQSVNDINGTTLTEGSWNVASGATLTFQNYASITVNQANVSLSGATANFPAMRSLGDNQGSFSLLGQNQFTTNGDFSNSGALALDAGSTLHVSGKFTAGSASTLAVTVGGTQSQGAQSAGVLQVSGAATLGGNLVVTLAPGTQIAATDRIAIASAASFGGSFGNVVNGERVATADGSGTFQVNYGSGSAYAPGTLILSDFEQTGANIIPSFFTGQVNLGSGTYYLTFRNGNIFGYYGFLSDPRYIFHDDLGYEYVFDAADGNDGVYLYDFASSSFFYTSPTFPFPYLYDFSLNAVLYYYPDPNNPQRYNTNGVRYFYNFATGKIITK